MEVTPDVPDGFWACLGPPVYTCVFPAGSEPDPAIVSAIRREVYPNYVPLWMIKEYRTPSGDKMALGYHAIGRWAPFPDDPERSPVKVTRPVGFPFHGGVIYAQKTWSAEHAPGSPLKAVAAPDAGLTYDWDVLYWMKAQAWTFFGSSESVGKQGSARLREAAELEQRILEKTQEEAKYRLRQHRRQVKAAIADACSY